MVNVPWCHDCNNPLGLCSCDDSSEQDFRDYHHGVVAELQKTIAAKDAAIERLVADNRVLHEALPSFEGVAKTKLDALTTQGWDVCGYAIVKDGQFGLVTTGAFVGWWSVAADNAERAEAQRDKLKEALTETMALVYAPAEDIKDAALSRARQALGDNL